MGATWAKDFARHNTCVAAIARGFYRAMVEAMPDKVLDKLRAQIPERRLAPKGSHTRYSSSSITTTSMAASWS
ncbi:hypothetical protein TW86_21540 [Halomonas sp. S2151]|nr:hypothetical protein TW86_21540 [Halomonas sp. S2151]